MRQTLPLEPVDPRYRWPEDLPCKACGTVLVDPAPGVWYMTNPPHKRARCVCGLEAFVNAELAPRGAITPNPKRGRVECPELLTWVRRRPCKACNWVAHCLEEGVDPARSTLAAWGLRAAPKDAPKVVQAHHWPAKGMGGARCRDDRVIPLCLWHHEEAQTYRIRSHVQDAWVRETLLEFLDLASNEEVRAYMLALERWKERPAWIPM